MIQKPVIVPEGPFEPTWESLLQYRVPDWYLDGQFGIFIHWGPYCVPAFGNEWYPRQMYLRDSPTFEHHVKTYGPQDRFGYKDFIPLFKAEKYDAGQWADLFAKAGARFVVPVAEHHDGFAMYDSGFSKWCAAKMGPKRDVVGELAVAVRERGMVFGASTHRAEHWWFMNGGTKFPSDVQDPKYADFYGPAQPDGSQPNAEFLEDWLARTCEIVDKYGAQLIWFDWWIEQPVFKPYLRRLAAYLYNRGWERGQGVAINYKNDAYVPGTAVWDIERGGLSGLHPFFWQTDTAVAKNSWGYVDGMDYKSPGQIVGDLVDIVSKNGALLLNIGPRADGTIPREDQRILLAIGKWLKVNGEAIYGTRPWKVHGEGPTQGFEGHFTDTKRTEFTGQDIRFTTKGRNTLYAICLAWPGKDVLIRSLGASLRLCSGAIGDVKLLGHRGKLDWNQEAEGLRVKLPAKPPCEHAFALRITRAG
jgi:alpha-L-fucosidase